MKILAIAGLVVIFIMALFTILFRYRMNLYFAIMILTNLVLVVLGVPLTIVLLSFFVMFAAGYTYARLQQRAYAKEYEKQEAKKKTVNKEVKRKDPPENKIPLRSGNKSAGLNELLDDFSDVISSIKTSPEIRDGILREIEDIKRVYNSPLLVCVLGEWSSGKSSFVNALLEQDLLATQDVETTATITRLQYSDKEFFEVHFNDGKTEKYELNENNKRYIERFYVDYTEDQSILDRTSLVTVALKSDFLKDFDLADTPGYNSDNNRHTELTDTYSKYADAIIWLFTADQFGKASEVKKLSEVCKYFKPVFVINKIDLVKLKDGETYEQKFASKLEKLEGLYENIFFTSSHRNNGTGSTIGIDLVKKYLSNQLGPNSRQIKETSIVVKLFETGKLIQSLRSSIADNKKIIDDESIKIESLIKENDSLVEQWNQICENWNTDVGDGSTIMEILSDYRDRYFLIQAPSNAIQTKVEAHLDNLYQMDLAKGRIESQWKQLMSLDKELKRLATTIEKRLEEYNSKAKKYWDVFAPEFLQSDELRVLNRDIEDHNKRRQGISENAKALEIKTEQFNNDYMNTENAAIDFLNKNLWKEVEKQTTLIEKKGKLIDELVDQLLERESAYDQYVSEIEVIDKQIKDLFKKAYNHISKDSKLTSSELKNDFDVFLKNLSTSLESRSAMNWDKIYTREKLQTTHVSSASSNPELLTPGRISDASKTYNKV